DQIKLRFGITFSIITSKQAQGKPVQIVLGLPGQNTKLDSLLNVAKLTVNAKSPGFNGYVIMFVKQNASRYIVLAGSDVNGVIFGQESLFDMLKRDKNNQNNIVVDTATIRDWPSIPWRGRPHSVLAHHLRNGELDGYIRARLNYSDVRDDPKVPASLAFDARKASMGLPPGEPMDTELLSKMISESHRRGIFIYGTVSCSVTMDKFDVLTKTYDELLKLGVDGLWISMDDTGGGDNPVELIRKIVAYCKAHNITGRRIAFTPPPAEYQCIDKPLNREMAKVQGFDDITWFFTRVPCKADLAMAREIGIKSKPAWWYNYVETGKYDGKCGFLHTSYLLTTLRKDGRPGYMDLQPLRWGWGFPEYEKIRDAADNTDQVHMWGLCGGWPTEYALANIGLWAWDPQTFDWEKFRRSVYRYVYGDSLVETMCQFDTKLDELKQYYQLASSGWRYNPAEQWTRLKDVKDRPEVLRRVRELIAMANKISAEAVKESALDRDRLEYQYLEPMRTSLVFAEKYATFDYLDYDYGTLSQKLDELFFEGKNAEAQQLHAKAIPVIRENLVRFEKTFADLKGVDLYKAKWERIITTTPEQWTQQQRAKMEQRWNAFSALSADKILPYLKTGQKET
ncbi:MAG: hypothetical protein Q4G59_11560, partial [Planctomycetia bacterium]|nr:hypothetical protein [Planctomycetia bacterium]